MKMPFFVIFTDTEDEEIASSIILATSRENAEAIAEQAVFDSPDLSKTKKIYAEPFTLDFINQLNEDGILIVEFNYEGKYSNEGGKPVNGFFN